MSFFGEIGLVLAAAALGGFAASRLKQPVVVWYILLGVALGPTALGLVGDDVILASFSEMGLLLLLFFVGLEFSFAKLRRVGKVAALIAVLDVALSVFTGFLLGKWLGWPSLDSLLLACVLAMSSASIAAKVLSDQKKLGTREGETLMGVLVFGDLLAILFVVGLSAVRAADGHPVAVAREVGLALFVYAAFIATSAFSAKKLTRLLERIHTDELLIPLALGLVFLSAFVADYLGLPAMTGAFFMGLMFSDTHLAHRLQSKVALFRDTFVAIFFITFGALIDVARFEDAARILLYAVPLVLVNEALLVALLAYLAGLPGRVAAAVGTGLTARGEEAVMFASLGAKMPGVAMGSLLSPFTGLFCLVMSTLMPFLFRASYRLPALLAAVVPGALRASARVVHVSMRAVMQPDPWSSAAKERSLRSFLRFAGKPKPGLALVRDVLGFGVAIGVAGAVGGVAHAVWIALSFAALCAALRSLHRFFRSATVAVAGNHAHPLGRALRTRTGRDGVALLPNVATSAFGGLLLAVFAVAVVWPFGWEHAPWVVPGYLAFLGVALTYYSLRLRLGTPREPAVALRAGGVGGGGMYVARRVPEMMMMNTGARR